MQYPLISEYVRAIQDAASNLDKLAHLEPVADKHGEPYRSSGAFAVVFKMRDPKTGRCYALKCFPVLLMDWIEGETMEAYIAAHWRDTCAMSMLCYRFCRMAAWLRSQPFAHGDIKPDNVMVREDGTLALVDYDGMFVPSMKGQKSPTIGTKDFSHPLRTVDDFDETIDDFTLASIALSLKAMSLDPTLREKYGAADRLLFSVDDYRDPGKSAVLAALQPLLTDADMRTLLSQFLLASAKKDLSQASFRLFTLPKPAEPEVLRTDVTEADLAAAVTDEYGVKYSPDGLRLLKAPPGLSDSYAIKPGTKVICDWAFHWCESFANIIFPNSVIRIGNSAFNRCSSLASITIPDSVTSIGWSVFNGCESLASITIPASVKEMRGNPFREWNGVLINESPCFIYEDGVLFSKSKDRIIAFRRKDVISYVIPNSVTSIGSDAFYECHRLMSITIPYSVTSIGDGSFSSCALRSIKIPDSVTSIGDAAFEWCTSLADIIIPNTVTDIGDGAFFNCYSLNKKADAEIGRRFGSRVFYYRWRNL